MSDEPRTATACAIAKQRNGPVGTVMLTFNKQFTRFDNHKPGGTDYVL